MEWTDLEINRERIVDLRAAFSNKDTTEISTTIGGIISEAEDLAWIACNGQVSTLHVVSLRQGYAVSRYSFNSSSEDGGRLKAYQVRCVAELPTSNPEDLVLAVCLEKSKSAVTYIALFSVRYNRVLRYITLNLHVTCLVFVDAASSSYNLLQNFDGCLAAGSEEGNVMLLDVNIKWLQPKQHKKSGRQATKKFAQAELFDCTESLPRLLDTFQNCRKKDAHFGLKIKFSVQKSSSAISSMLAIGFVFSLAVGYQDGRIVVFDVSDFRVICIVEAKHEEEKTVVQCLTYLMPPGELDSYFYLCAVHASKSGLSVSLHKLAYEHRVLMAEQVGSFFLMNIRSCSLSLRMLLESSTVCNIVSCQSITAANKNAAVGKTLCSICWHCVTEQKTKVVLFDLNQWHKEQSPDFVSLLYTSTYLAGYTLSEGYMALHMQINPNSIVHFNAQQQFEEYLYPNSLSFECASLMPSSFRIYNVVGAQQRLIDKLRSGNATIFLNPAAYHAEILRKRLMPKLCEQSSTPICSKKAMCEVIFSVALEYNCLGLLRDYAKRWVRPIYICNLAKSTELSILTLTEWIFKYANKLKARCNDICKHILNGLEALECEELHYVTRLMRLLVKLQGEVVEYGSGSLPIETLSNFSSNESAMRLTTDYQDVLNWLLSNGVLSKVTGLNFSFEQLRQFFESKRRLFSELSKEHISPVSGACRLLFIDALLLQYYEESSTLSDFWPLSGCVYPPVSLVGVLGIMRVPKLDFEQKCAVVLYALFDLNSVHELECLKNFHLQLNLSQSLVKTVDVFWHLDHDKFAIAVDKYLSPINNAYKGLPWQLELMVQSLLVQDAAKLAFRVLTNETGSVSPLLRLKTLLANDMDLQAFHLARQSPEESLLAFFFSSCVNSRKLDLLFSLVLSPHEERLLEQTLRDSKLPESELMYVTHMLQKSQFIETSTYTDKMARTNKRDFFCDENRLMCELLQRSYKATMVPVTQKLTDTYLRFRNQIHTNQINSCKPMPFSSQLMTQHSDSLAGGICHSAILSVLSVDLESAAQSNDYRQTDNKDQLLSTLNVPLLRKHSIFTNQNASIVASHPKPYEFSEKRASAVERNFGGHTINADAIQCNEQSVETHRTLSENSVLDLEAHFGNKNLAYAANNQHDAVINDVESKSPLTDAEYQSSDAAASLPTTDLNESKDFEQSEASNCSEDVLRVGNEMIEELELSDNEDNISDDIEEIADNSKIFDASDLSDNAEEGKDDEIEEQIEKEIQELQLGLDHYETEDHCINEDLTNDKILTDTESEENVMNTQSSSDYDGSTNGEFVEEKTSTESVMEESLAKKHVAMDVFETKGEVVRNETQDCFQKGMKDTDATFDARALPAIPEEAEEEEGQEGVEEEVRTLKKVELVVVNKGDVENLTTPKQNDYDVTSTSSCTSGKSVASQQQLLKRNCRCYSVPRNVGSELGKIKAQPENASICSMSNVGTPLRRSTRLAAAEARRLAQKRLSESHISLVSSTESNEISRTNSGDDNFDAGSPGLGTPKAQLHRNLRSRSKGSTTKEAKHDVRIPKTSVVRKLFQSETLPGNEAAGTDDKEHQSVEIRPKRARRATVDSFSKDATTPQPSKRKNAKSQQPETSCCRTRTQCIAARHKEQPREEDDNNTSDPDSESGNIIDVISKINRRCAGRSTSVAKKKK